MEIRVTDHPGLPDDAIVSMRFGITRRQAPLGVVRRHPFKFPSTLGNVCEPLKIDVLQPLASTRLVLHSYEESYCIGFEEKNMGLGLDIQPSGTNAAKVEEQSSPEVPVRYQDAAASARDYLESHGLLRYVQSMLHAVIQVRPKDPYAFMISQLTAAETQSKTFSPAPSRPTSACTRRAEERDFMNAVIDRAVGYPPDARLRADVPLEHEVLNEVASLRVGASKDRIPAAVAVDAKSDASILGGCRHQDESAPPSTREAPKRPPQQAQEAKSDASILGGGPAAIQEAAGEEGKASEAAQVTLPPAQVAEPVQPRRETAEPLAPEPVQPSAPSPARGCDAAPAPATQEPLQPPALATPLAPPPLPPVSTKVPEPLPPEQTKEPSLPDALGCDAAPTPAAQEEPSQPPALETAPPPLPSLATKVPEPLPLQQTKDAMAPQLPQPPKETAVPPPPSALAPELPQPPKEAVVPPLPSALVAEPLQPPKEPVVPPLPTAAMMVPETLPPPKEAAASPLPSAKKEAEEQPPEPGAVPQLSKPPPVPQPAAPDDPPPALPTEEEGETTRDPDDGSPRATTPLEALDRVDPHLNSLRDSLRLRLEEVTETGELENILGRALSKGPEEPADATPATTASSSSQAQTPEMEPVSTSSSTSPKEPVPSTTAPGEDAQAWPPAPSHPSPPAETLQEGPASPEEPQPTAEEQRQEASALSQAEATPPADIPLPAFAPQPVPAQPMPPPGHQLPPLPLKALAAAAQVPAEAAGDLGGELDGLPDRGLPPMPTALSMLTISIAKAVPETSVPAPSAAWMPRTLPVPPVAAAPEAADPKTPERAPATSAVSPQGAATPPAETTMMPEEVDAGQSSLPEEGAQGAEEKAALLPEPPLPPPASSSCLRSEARAASYPQEAVATGGTYIIVHHNTFVSSSVAVPVTDTDVIAHIEKGRQVRVLEVAPGLQQSRVRARIDSPAGWISLSNLDNGYRWAVPLAGEQKEIMSLKANIESAVQDDSSLQAQVQSLKQQMEALSRAR